MKATTIPESRENGRVTYTHIQGRDSTVNYSLRTAPLTEDKRETIKRFAIKEALRQSDLKIGVTVLPPIHETTVITISAGFRGNDDAAKAAVLDLGSRVYEQFLKSE
jgi:hypothetical protein